MARSAWAVLASAAAESQWVELGGGAGGYSVSPALSAAPSLYQTAWNARLARLMQLDLPGLRPGVARSWLEPLLAGGWRGGVEGLSPVATLSLAVGALGDLAQPVPKGQVVEAVALLRTGDRYARMPGQAGDWGSTALALAMVTRVGAPDDAEVAGAIRNELAAMRGRPMAPADIDRAVSVWQAADLVLPSSERRGYLPQLRELLSLRSPTSASAGPLTAADLSDMLDLNTIAEANQQPLPFPPPEVANLVRPSGYLTTGWGQPTDDPQTTADAVALGWQPPEILARTMRARAWGAGWRDPPTQPDPEASLEAILTLRASGDRSHEAELRVLVKRWLASSIGTGPATPSYRQTYFLALLADRLGIPAAASLRAGFAHASPDVQKGSDASLWKARFERFERIGTPDWPAAPAGRERMYDVLASVLLTGNAPSGWEEDLRKGGGWAANQQAQYPDLASTAIAAAILRLDSGRRDAAAAEFGVQDLYWMLPQAAGAGNFADLYTEYLGGLLLGQITDPAPLHVSPLT